METRNIKDLGYFSIFSNSQDKKTSKLLILAISLLIVISILFIVFGEYQKLPFVVIGGLIFLKIINHFKYAKKLGTAKSSLASSHANHTDYIGVSDNMGYIPGYDDEQL